MKSNSFQYIGGGRISRGEWRGGGGYNRIYFLLTGGRVNNWGSLWLDLGRLISGSFLYLSPWLHYLNIITWYLLWLLLGSKRWRSGERAGAICGLNLLLVFLLCSKRFFARYSSFPLSSKTNISKFQFDQESGRRRTTLWMCYLQIIIIYLLLLLLLLDLLPILRKNVFWYAMLESKSLTGKRQTRSSYNLKYCNLLWFSPPNMSLVLQRGSFVPCEWLAAIGIICCFNLCCW